MNDVRPSDRRGRYTPRRVIAGVRRRIARRVAPPGDASPQPTVEVSRPEVDHLQGRVDELRARVDALTIELERARRAAADAVAVAAAGLPHVVRPGPLDVVRPTSSGPVGFRRGEPAELAVVMVTYGHRAIVVEALERLGSALEGAGRAAEVVVVDQPHPERGHLTADLVEATTSGVGLLRSSSNRGFAGGNNLGVASTSAPTLCLLNPDVLIDASQIDELLHRLESQPEAIVSPRLVFRDGRTQELGWRVIADGETRPVLDGDAAAPDYASAACWWLRRSTFESLDGFDEGYHPAYYEDSDFALRAAAAGHPTVIADDVSVIHEWSFTTREVEPDVSAQRARFVSKFPQLIAERADELRPT